MKIVLRFGDLMLKGRNRKMFINKIRSHVTNKFKNNDVITDFRHDRIYLEFNEAILKEVETKINEIPGISSYSLIYVTNQELDSIKELAVNILNTKLDSNKTYQFKIETKRSNKRFPLTSIEFTQAIAPLILEATKMDLNVDVKNPDITLNIDIRDDGTYIYLDKIKAMGGYPAGIAGKGILMMSGGIDSPVAAYLTIKQGVEVELMHFESSPMTPLESVNKVIDLATKLAVFFPNEKIKLHLVPFAEIHKEILKKVSNSYSITIMRRMMYRISEKYANNKKIPIIINGESIGQVASQTLNSMLVVEAVTKLPIIRPLATYDKQDIISIARKIDTYKTSIKPFQDCCSIYVPENPVINPTIKKCLEEELKGDFDQLIEQAIQEIETLVITKDTKIELEMHGFTVKEALRNMREQQ